MPPLLTLRHSSILVPKSLIDWGLAENLGLKSKPLVSPIKARALNGKELFLITQTTEPLELQIQEHMELLTL